jgi:AraC-like DNA-binding protein
MSQGEAWIAWRIDMAAADKRGPVGTTEPAAQSFSTPTLPRCTDSGIGTLVPQLRERRLRRAMEIISSQPPHSVRDLARELRLSPTHLQRLFKQETGVQIGRLLAEYRLNKATELLSGTDMEIKEIAYKVGYGHHSSFVRAFQRRFGQSPKRYRQKTAA